MLIAISNNWGAIVSHELLRVEKVSKSFKGVKALHDVDFSITAGKIHGLVGANGAGKSTLMKIISGAYICDGGELFFEGKSFRHNGIQDVLHKGIVTIYQDFNLIDSMTVAENIFLNNELVFKHLNIIKDKNLMNTNATQLLHDFDLDIDPDIIVGKVPNDIKKMVQIIRAVAMNARVLLLDEPTSSLTQTEEQSVLKLMKTLAEKNVGIVFISHYLSEIFEICDDITVLKDGIVVEHTEVGKTSLESIVEKMIGKDITETVIEKKVNNTGETLLEVNNIQVRNKLKNISFNLKKGEILGITGLVGAGCTELARVIFGSEDIKKESGGLIIEGESKNIRNTTDAINNGIAYLTNDRVNEGLLPGKTLWENIFLPSLKKYKNKINILNRKAMLNKGSKYISKLSIKTPNIEVLADTLSGGNQQKVVFAKWLEMEPKIFIMDEPTIGIDVGSKVEIKQIIREIAKRGVGVILITSELEELEKLCDRVLVMFRGEIINELTGDDINQTRILETLMKGDDK